MSKVYFFFAATFLIIAIVTLAMGEIETARYTAVCSLLSQILMRLEEKTDG